MLRPGRRDSELPTRSSSDSQTPNGGKGGGYYSRGSGLVEEKKYDSNNGHGGNLNAGYYGSPAATTSMSPGYTVSSGGSGGGGASNYGGHYSGGSSNIGNVYQGSGKYNKRRGSGSGGGINLFVQILKEPVAWASMVALVCFAMMMSNRSAQNAFLKRTGTLHFEDAIEAWDTIERMNKHFKSEMAKYKSEAKLNARKIVEETSKLEASNQGLEQLHEERETKVTAREAAWKDQVELLQRATKKESRRVVVET